MDLGDEQAPEGIGEGLVRGLLALLWPPRGLPPVPCRRVGHGGARCPRGCVLLTLLLVLLLVGASVTPRGQQPGQEASPRARHSGAPERPFHLLAA